METWIKWAAEGSPGGLVDPSTTELHEHADADLWFEVQGELADERQSGHVRAGRPSWRDARLLQVDWDRTVQDLVVPEAVFEVCVDDTDWILVDADTEDPVSAEVGGPHVWTVTAWWVEDRDFGPDGWAVVERRVDRSRPC